MNLLQNQTLEYTPKRIFSSVMFILATLLALIVPVACIDDLPGPSSGPIRVEGDEVLVQLPCTFSVQVANSNATYTRDGDSDPNVPKFEDGDDSEYAFAEVDDCHFVVIYKKSQPADTDKPLAIFPLSIPESEWKNLDPAENITLTAKSMVISEKMWAQSNSIEAIRGYLADAEAYVLLNFSCSQIYDKARPASYSASKSNAANLYNFTRKELKNLQLSDYKITVDGTSYFTMSNAVYADASNNIVVDYAIVPGNVFETEAEVTAPAIAAHVERLAVKYTVDFTHSLNESSGLPIYEIDINQYDRYEYSDQGYAIISHPVKAAVYVKGYFINNTEKTSYAIKKLPENFTTLLSPTASLPWNSESDWRSYWSEDPNYLLSSWEKSSAKGYPHQFRQALEVDSVHLHGVDAATGAGYKYPGNQKPETTVTRKVMVMENGIPKRDENGNIIYTEKVATFYTSLGEYDFSSLNTDCVLRYWSYKEMADAYDKLTTTEDGKKPFYSLENTYYDPGMSMAGIASQSEMVWNWMKAPYSAATTLTMLCELVINGEVGDNNSGRTVYRGQNNVFYFELTGDNGLLRSKLDILNHVILNQGNAGLNIINAWFASHGFLKTGDDAVDDAGNVNLVKVAWNKGSVLWIGKVEDDGTEIEHWEATENDLCLIPAEIAGGDGQCLIAPKTDYLGPNHKFYLAPVRMVNGQPVDDQGKPVPDGGQYYRDFSKSVEISFNHLVGLIHKSIGPIDVFTDGRMYYSIPVPHRVSSLNMTGSSPSWKTLGNIGAVRNNWYNITVSNITDVGIPVENADQPIVPVMDIHRNYINANVSIYGWHSLKQEDIPLQ